MEMKTMTMIEIKERLASDAAFRSLFPEYKEEIDDFLLDTSCACHASLYRKISKVYDEKIHNRKFVFKVINCHTDELEEILQTIPKNSKIESMARYENQITIIIRFLQQ
jgi:hypothetical protein